MSGPSRFLRRWGFPRLSGPWELPADPARFPVFLLMGQSNMAGWVAPQQPADFSPVPRALALGGQCTLKSRRPRGWARWQPAAHPLHLNQKGAGFGLALPFASRLLDEEKRPELTVGLIPCAWGGAGIDQLGPGTPLYDNAVRRARIAALRGTLAGVLWHQGETDGLDDSLAPSHAGKLAALIARLRLDLAMPELPFLIGNLGTFGDEKRSPAAIARRDTVRAGLRRVAAETARAAFVESEGLDGVDDVHFSRAALIEFGRRYADAYLGLR